MRKQLYAAYDANNHHLCTISCEKLDALTLQMFSVQLQDAVMIINDDEFKRLPFAKQVEMIRANQ